MMLRCGQSSNLHDKSTQFYCHTMLCISAVYAVMRCVSVCVSVTFVNSVKTNKCIFKIFSPSVKPFWFFNTKRYSNIPMGTPLMGASNAGEVGRNRDSEPISAFTAYAVKRSSSKCSKLNRDEPCRVYNIAGERPSLLMAVWQETMTKCMTRSLNVTPKTTLCSGKSET